VEDRPCEKEVSQTHVRSEGSLGGMVGVRRTDALSPASGGAGATVGAVPISVSEAVTVARLIGVVRSIRVSPVLCPRRPSPLRRGRSVHRLIRSSLLPVVRTIVTRVVRCQTRVTDALFTFRRNVTYRISTRRGLGCLRRIRLPADGASVGSRRGVAIPLGSIVCSIGGAGTVLSIAVR
jgi:hypothetical protein